MRFVLALLLVAHGVAHLVGFVSSWKLAVYVGLALLLAIGARLNLAQLTP